RRTIRDAPDLVPGVLQQPAEAILVVIDQAGRHHLVLIRDAAPAAVGFLVVRRQAHREVGTDDMIDVHIGAAVVIGTGADANAAGAGEVGLLADHVDHAAALTTAIQYRGRSLHHFDALDIG